MKLSLAEIVKMYEEIPGGFVIIGSPIYKYGVDIPYVTTVVNLVFGKALIPTIQAMSRATTLSEGKTQASIIEYSMGFSKVLKSQLKKRLEHYRAEGYVTPK
jgi:hypothetical protein